MRPLLAFGFAGFQHPNHLPTHREVFTVFTVSTVRKVYWRPPAHRPDLFWHFTTDEALGRTNIHCEPAEESEYEAMLRHIADGVETVTDLSELMGKGKGAISKWVKRGESAGRLKRSGPRIIPD